MNVYHKITISLNEAVIGTKRILTRNGKRLEVTIPFGVRTGTIVRLKGARRITDGYDGDILVRIKVRRWNRVGISVVAIIVILTIIPAIIIDNIVNIADDSVEQVTNVPTLQPVPDITDSDYITVFHDTQPPFYIVSGKSIRLENNPDATDPTRQQLWIFLISDKTDSEVYVPFTYECGHFAQDVHNNAEAAGIRAAWVAVWFEDESEGHAINAFNTVDAGLIYIDCSGLEFSERFSGEYREGSLDMVATVKKGRNLMEVHISQVESLSYLFKEEYTGIYFKPFTKIETVDIYW